MIKKIKSISPDNSIILKNLSYLTFLRVFNIGIKFLLVAYLVRVLGEFSYGILTWSDAVIQYFIMFVNFGFNIYAAKYIVENKDNNEKINQITSSIFTIKLLLLILSFTTLFILSFFNPFALHKSILFLMLLMGIGEVFFPIWYFQGIEKLKPATFIVVFSRVLLIIGTILLVKSSSDLILHVILIVISNSIMGFLGYVTLLKKYNFKFIRVKFEVLRQFVQEAYMFFLGRFLSLTFNFATIFLIGIYFTMDYVTGFDVALKIVLVSIIPFDMLQQAVFPTISRNKNKNVLKKLIWGSFVLGLIFMAVLYQFSEQLLGLFGGQEMTKYADVLRALALITPMVAVTFMLGTCTLVAFDFHKEFNYSLILSSILYIAFVAILTVLDKVTFWNLVYLRIISDFALVSIRLYYTFKRKIFTNSIK
ncbi:oligosaccharide flippase family protein [Aureibaculum conchae]|uniref:oligosaccharide flippase family protein n=1 Tax=Aureibaculum sp. 2308TA14-22 TaxID=3108392 RepID=UPI003390E4E9